MLPVEKNGRKLIGVIVQCFPLGATTEELRREFEKATSLKRQAFYDSLRFVKQQGWLTGGGSPTRHGVSYQLSPDGSWKPPSVGGAPGDPPLSRDQLEYLADARAQKIEELQNQLEHVRDWSSGGNANGVVANLARIVSDHSASLRQRLKAASVIVSYKASDAGATEFAKRFLESLCANPDIGVDYQIAAGEVLRRAEDSRIVPAIERPAARTDNDPTKPAEEIVPLPELLRQRKEYMRRRWAEILEEMPELKPYHPTPPRNGDDQ